MIDASLGDILYVLNPTFSSELIKRLETNARESRAFDGTMYTPGVVGKDLFLVIFMSKRECELYVIAVIRK